MVTTYYVISRRLSSHFWVKMHVLSTFFNNKRKTCQWNDAKGLFKCYFTCEAQKIIIYRDFNLISNSWWNPRWRPLLVTSQASSNATTHEIYLICWEDQSLSTEGKIVSKYKLQHIKNSKDGFHQPQPLLYHGGCMNLRVRPSVTFSWTWKLVLPGCFLLLLLPDS